MDNIEVNELMKYNDLQGEWSTITGFLSWLEENNVMLAERYGPERLIKATAPLKTMLADYYNIDLIQVAKEKEQLVDHYLNELVASK